MLLLDIVNLKAVNDRFGYAAGDEVIRTVADALVDLTAARNALPDIPPSLSRSRFPVREGGLTPPEP